ncbi:MAG: DUF3558 family protein [Sciscionella sp.]
MKRVRIAGAVLGAALVAATGCGSTVGEAQPQGGGPASGSDGVGISVPQLPGGDGSVGGSPSELGAGSGSGGSTPLSNVEPCLLLPTEAANRLGLGQGKRDDMSGYASCRWNPDGYTFGIALFTDLSIDEVQAIGKPQRVSVGDGQRKAVRSFGGGGAVCAISIEVTASSRVDVSAVEKFGNKQKACRLATQGANAVEPHLPEG